MIHSSPYKRCMQTSIAIAAGLKYPEPERLRPLPIAFQRSSLSSPPIGPDGQRAPSGLPNEEAPRSQPNGKPQPYDEKYEVKIDPWIGEWLSTSYFEDSVPPPSGNLIIARAKETLTRSVQEIRGADLSAFVPVAESPADDDENENDSSNNSLGEKGGLRAMAVIGHSLAHRSRATSFGRDLANNSRPLSVEKLRQRSRTTTYSPPLPQYSLAPQDPIPAGYVAHARDACVQPNLQWDSVAMGWGDGGGYPEEWSGMHVRFRLGLQRLLAYYKDQETLSSEGNDGSEDDPEEDLIVVLVTHQAGANALIRLMTGAPALHDIGVASLTLAVRRPVLRRPPSLAGTSHSPLGFGRESRRNSRRGSLDLGLADEFEMRIIASTEHLRHGSNPLGLNSPRLGQSPALAGRRMVGGDSLEGFSIGDPLAWRSSSSGSQFWTSSQRRRASDVPSKPATNTGLWGSPAIPATVREPVDEGLENLPPMSPKSRPTTPSADTDSIPESKLSSPTRSRSNTVQGIGLWGSSNTSLNAITASGEGSISRARSPAKRTWAAVSNSP